MTTCPRRAGVLGAVAAAGDAPAAVVRHADACGSCRELADAARRAAARAAAPLLDCDGAEVLLAELDDDGALPPADLAALLAHLSGCAACRDALWLGEDAHELDEDAPPPATLPVVPHAAYRVERELARGGMGKVSRARDRRLGRVVALKEPIGLTESWARLEREARIAGRLGHPGIVSVYEAGRWATGAPFCAMQLVEGRPLDEVIAAAGTLAARLALLPHAVAVADALAYAHSQRVIHRDLKPSNVLVGDFGETVVIDWGLAKDLAAPGADGDGVPAGPFRALATPAGAGALTQHGQALGTPAYMPPEQARGEPVDERADVYAIGALTYHLLAGRPPHAEPDAGAVLRAVLAGPPPPLAAAEPGVPRELAAIVAKAMARAPAERYPSARELADDLRRFATGKLVRAHEYSLVGLARHWLRHRRVSVGIALALVALLAGTLVVSATRIVRERDRARRALVEVERRNADLLLERARRALQRDATEAVALLAQVPVDERNWREARAVLADARGRGVAEHELEGHAGLPEQVVVAPDGATVASSDERGELRLWRPAAGEVRVLGRHDGRVYELAFDAAGRRLAAVGEGGVELYDLAAAPGTAPRRLEGSAAVAPLWTGAFSADGAELVTGGADGTVRAWPLDGGNARLVWGTPSPGPRYTITLHARASDTVFVLAEDGRVALVDHAGRERWIATHPGGLPPLWAMAPDGGHVATWGEGDRVRWWSTADGAWRELGAVPRASFLAVSPDGSHVAAGTQTGLVRVWSVSSGAVTDLVGHEREITTVAFAPDGARLLSGSVDRTVRVWSLGGGEDWRLGGHRDTVQALAVLADGRVLSLARDGRARVWRPGARATRVVGRHGGEAFEVWLGADGRTVSASFDGSLLAAARSFPGAPGRSADLWVTPDGAHAAVRDGAGACRVVSLAAGGASTLLPGDAPCARALDLAADGRAAVTVDAAGTARLWRLAGDAPPAPATLPLARVREARLRDGGSVLAFDEAGAVWRWRPGAVAADRLGALPLAARRRTGWSADGRVVASLVDGRLAWLDDTGARGEVAVPFADASAFYLADDGARAAVWTRRGELVVVALAGGAVQRLPGHGAAVRFARFSPDGRRLASTAEDELVVWDLATGERRALWGHGRWIDWLAFSPDGRRLASVGQDGLVRVWSEEDEAPLPDGPAATAQAVRRTP